MMEINIKTIPHKAQRYNTCGDWQIEQGIINVQVSNMQNEDYAFLIGLHEQIEAYLTFKRGIKEADIMAFDIAFSGEGDAGDSKDAPYKKEHFFATSIERLMAEQLNVNWQEYGKVIEELF